jgi:nucleolar protein 56
MPKYPFISILGSFDLDGGKLIEKKLFSSVDEYKKEQESAKITPEILASLKGLKYLPKFRVLNLALTKEKIKASVNDDNLICQATSSIDEADKVINILSKRLREWYSLYNPEFTASISNNEKFAELIIKKSKKELLKEAGAKDSMGAELSEQDLASMMALADQLKSLFSYKEQTKKYLEKLMQKHCPNLRELAGVSIGAKLLEHTGSLKRLALLPASTIQILGAEKALFRHIKTGARPPKYGLIFAHEFIQQAKKKDQGKRARALADKLSMAIRVDYFKGKPIAAKLKKELEAKFK